MKPTAYVAKPFTDCPSEVRECRANQGRYPDEKRMALMGELDWMQEHLLSGGSVKDLI